MYHAIALIVTESGWKIEIKNSSRTRVHFG